ncbi:substrate-binding periplasmic protein [Pseudomonas japonica]|uniref:substrate-binding periplasmic protein n=1 Tax=Pseudomonas japonica TaxID=256466 RepID=UPI0015E28899|nr:transporter substrate-binding domain-containing protein [Pseudomonas japonica]MBA1244403.1 transporter substrate-binding domain-containing protein [Pseudomonas japonica]
MSSSLKSVLLATVLTLCLPAAARAAGEIEVVTEEMPPYNMTENGKVTGFSTDIVQAVMKEAGIDAPIQVMPWARAYDRALSVPNVLIYSIARTPEREALFQWVGPIAPTNWYLYSLAERPVTLHSLDDARGQKIATVNMDVGQQFLLSRGFKMGTELQSTSRYENNYRMLKIEHVGLWISNELNAIYLMRQNGDDPERALVRSLPLPELSSPEGLSLAFSKGTSPAIVERFKKALNTVRQNGTYEALMHKWLSSADH